MAIRKIPRLEEFWSPESLKEWIERCQYHTKEHQKSCQCYWCRTVFSLRYIAQDNLGIVHGPRCKENCYHVKTFNAGK